MKYPKSSNNSKDFFVLCVRKFANVFSKEIVLILQSTKNIRQFKSNHLFLYRKKNVFHDQINKMVSKTAIY